jgi:Phosphate-selective porin O and P
LGARLELRLDPTEIINTGSIAGVSAAQVYSAEAAAAYGPFFFQGEYFWYNVARNNLPGLPSLKFNGGYAEASLVLTGETHPLYSSRRRLWRHHPGKSVLDMERRLGGVRDCRPRQHHESERSTGDHKRRGRWTADDLQRGFELVRQ